VPGIGFGQSGNSAYTNVRLQMKKGVKLIEESIGEGEPLERQNYYQVKFNFWLNKGEAIVWDEPWGLLERAELKDGGKTLITDIRFDRLDLISGLFYGLEGMKIGGTRKLRIAPHLAYGETGVPNVIPPNAVLICEVSILEKKYAT